MRKLFFIVLLFTTIFNFSGFAQEKTPVNEPILFDEFGDFGAEYLQMKLDSFVQTVDSTSKMQILFYGGEKDLPGLRYREEARIQQFLKTVKGISPDRMIFSQCGVEKEIKIQLYEIPMGVEKINCEEAFIPTNKTILYDDHYIFDLYKKTGGDGCCVIETFDGARIRGSYEGFAKYLNQNSESKGYLIVTPEKNLTNDAGKKLSALEIKKETNATLKYARKILRQNGVKPAQIATIAGNPENVKVGGVSKEIKGKMRHFNLYADFVWKFWIVPKYGEIPKEIAPYLKRKKPAKKR